MASSASRVATLTSEVYIFRSKQTNNIFGTRLSPRVLVCLPRWQSNRVVRSFTFDWLTDAFGLTQLESRSKLNRGIQDLIELRTTKQG